MILLEILAVIFLLQIAIISAHIPYFDVDKYYRRRRR